MSFSRLIIISAALVSASATLAVQDAAPTAELATEIPAESVADPAVVPAPTTPAAPVEALEAENAVATAGDPAAGQTKSAACAACHGADGNSVDPQYPKQAGQHEHYIARQLALYKNGGRDNAIMLGFAATLSAQDMRDIGAYFASLKPLPGVADDTTIQDGPYAGKKFFEIGEKIYHSGDAARGIPACTACHGPAGAGVPGPSWPRLAGQHAQYTSAKLTAFRGGEVWGKDAQANVIMAGVARNLTDDEIQSLASYIEGLHNINDDPSKKTAP